MRLVVGVDGGAEWRGAYFDEPSCIDFLAQHGGIVAAMTTAARRAGLSETAVPKRGDIAVIAVMGTSTGSGLIGAICTGKSWAAMSYLGLRIVRAVPVIAWSVPYG